MLSVYAGLFDERRGPFRERGLEQPADSVLEAFTAARRRFKATEPEPYHWAPYVLLGRP